MNQSRILFLHKGPTSFVKADFELLKKHYDVHNYFLKPSKKVLSFFYYHFRFLIFMLFNFRKFDLIYSWFGDYHAYHASILSKLLGLKHIIVVGGNDAVSIPSIGFGVYYKNDFRSKLISKAYKLADVILCVDESLIQGENTYVEGDNKVGIENFVPGIKEKCVVVPTGFNADFWNCGSVKKVKQVLTVGFVDSEMRAILKGFDLIVQLADKLSDIDFIFIGIDEGVIDPQFKKRKNLTIINRTSQNELKKYYCKSKVFAQFSVTEGLPNTLCEAMICKCIVVGTNVNGIPKMIRNDELILHKKDVDQASQIILMAMQMPDEVGTENREFIRKNYSEEARIYALQEVIKNLLPSLEKMYSKN